MSKQELGSFCKTPGMGLLLVQALLTRAFHFLNQDYFTQPNSMSRCYFNQNSNVETPQGAITRKIGTSVCTRGGSKESFCEGQFKISKNIIVSFRGVNKGRNVGTYPSTLRMNSRVFLFGYRTKFWWNLILPICQYFAYIIFTYPSVQEDFLFTLLILSTPPFEYSAHFFSLTIVTELVDTREVLMLLNMTLKMKILYEVWCQILLTCWVFDWLTIIQEFSVFIIISSNCILPEQREVLAEITQSCMLI